MKLDNKLARGLGAPPPDLSDTMPGKGFLEKQIRKTSSEHGILDTFEVSLVFPNKKHGQLGF